MYPGISGAGDASKYHPPAKETIVFVYGIGPETDENQLWQMFSPFGNIAVSTPFSEFLCNFSRLMLDI